MPSLSGKSLSFGWLNCAVLLLLVLSGPLLVGCLQKWLVTSESFHGHKGNNHRSLRRILCLGDEFLDVESETCQKCPVCPYGYKLNKACGNGLGADATCSHCTSDYYQRDGECYPCKFCQGREILQKCTNTSNTKCSSQCLEGYFMAVSKQCIRRVNQRPKPAHPRRTPQPASSELSMQTSTTTSEIDISIIYPLSIVKVQNESNSKLPFPEHTTPSVNEKERNDSVSSTIVAFLFFGSLLLVVVVVCLVKGNVISTAVLKDKICMLCSRSKSKQSAEEDVELADPENNSPNAPAKSFETQTSQPLLMGGDTQSHEDVFISSEKIEDDAFLPETENKRKAADDPEIQNRGSHDQDEGEIRHRFAATVIFISRALAKEDLESLKSYLCIAISNEFTESDKESADSFEKVATILQQRLICSWLDTGILVKGLMSINRLDLAQKLEKLDKPEKSDQPRRLRRSSSRQD